MSQLFIIPNAQVIQGPAGVPGPTGPQGPSGNAFSVVTNNPVAVDGQAIINSVTGQVAVALNSFWWTITTLGALIMETGDYLMTETGDVFILENCNG